MKNTKPMALDQGKRINDMRNYILLLFCFLAFSCSKGEKYRINPKMEFTDAGMILINNDNFDYYNVSIIIDGKYYAYCGYLPSKMRKGFSYFEVDTTINYEKVKNARYNISLQNYEKNQILFTNELNQEVVNNKIVSRKS